MTRIWMAAALTLGALVIPATSAGAQTVTCNGVPATIIGTDGDDVLTGTAARDVIAALGGDDNVSSAAGDDLVCLGAGNDSVRGGDGNDTAFGGDGNDRFVVPTVLDGRDIFAGQAGTDTADYSARPVDLIISTDNSADDGAPGEGDNVRPDVEIVIGGAGNDRIAARNNAVRSRIEGRNGNDNLNILDGALGDVGVGGSGDDICTSDVGEECTVT